jgi:hypothetical protein
MEATYESNHWILSLNGSIKKTGRSLFWGGGGLVKFGDEVSSVGLCLCKVEGWREE